MKDQISVWNGLEITKLIISAATPIVVLLLGIWVTRLARRLEQLQWTNRTIVERRIKVFDSVASQLNDLVCYYSYVGNWKELTPLNVIDLKRELDKKIHIAAPLFSERFLVLYFNFIHKCFATYSGWGRDALLRTGLDKRIKTCEVPWELDWKDLFSDEHDIEDPVTVREAYQEFMSHLTKELGIGIENPIIPSGRIPGNIWKKFKNG